MSLRRPPSSARDTVGVAAIAAAVRVMIVAWAASRFPPSGDGQYYAKLAGRVAEGLGYTWAWPDGVVTYAAHYPVGYPALVALAYRVLGPTPASAMWLNALLGTLATVAAHRILVGRTTRVRAWLGALVVALHPALLMYTPAFMTEGVTASLLVIALALVLDRSRVGFVLGAIVLGIATLVRPQCLLLAPALGLVAGAKTTWRGSAIRALGATAMVLAVCAPWTARNCARMNRCALVSVNGGWNLLIGVQTTTGGWEELDVPENCREVFDEAGKDACFDRAAKERIAAAPSAWLARAPQKLAVTFDYFGAAPWYLHMANGASFTEEDKLSLATIETVVSRLLLAAALLTVGLRARRHPVRAASIAVLVATAVGVVFALSRHAWPAYVIFAALGVVELSRARDRVLGFGVAVVAATLFTHAVFFGAGRYGLVVVPFISLLPFARREMRVGASVR